MRRSNFNEQIVSIYVKDHAAHLLDVGSIKEGLRKELVMDLGTGLQNCVLPADRKSIYFLQPMWRWHKMTH